MSTTRRITEVDDLALTLVAMQVFDLDGETVRTWLKSSTRTITATIARVTAGHATEGAPYATLTDAVRDEHKQYEKEINAALKALGVPFKTVDSIDSFTLQTTESAAFLGFLLGWQLRGLMSDKGGAR